MTFRRLVHRTIAAAVTCAGLTPLVASRAEDAPPATRSIDEVRAAVSVAQERIRSLLIEFQGRDLSRPPDEYIASVVAAKGPNRYQFVEHRAGGVAGVDLALHQSYYDVVSWNVYFPLKHRYEITRKFAVHPYTLKARGATIYLALGWWPPDDTSAPPALDDKSRFLQSLLKLPTCRVRPAQERIDGRWCHVVDVPGLDTLWIDFDEGLLIRHDCYVGDPPRLRARYRLEEFREVAPGVKLPFKIVNEFEPDTSEFKILRYRVNDLTDDMFRFTPGPGTLIVDRDSDSATQVPGGLDFLRSNEDRLRAFVGSSSASWDSPTASPAAWCGLGIAAGMGCYGLVGMLRFRLRR
jgi:hypothetical protein